MKEEIATTIADARRTVKKNFIFALCGAAPLGTEILAYLTIARSWIMLACIATTALCVLSLLASGLWLRCEVNQLESEANANQL